MTCFLGDIITLTHGCLTEGSAGSLPEARGIPHLHCPGKRWRGTPTSSSPAVPMSTGSLVLYYPLSIPALAEVIAITISNLLFFLAPPSSPQFPCLFHVPFHVSPPSPSLLSSSHRLSALGRTQRPLAKVHLLACSCTSISILKDTCNLKYCSCVLHVYKDTTVSLEKPRWILKQSIRPQKCAKVPPCRCLRGVAVSTNIQLPVKK